jgi:hypothetical protein
VNAGGGRARILSRDGSSVAPKLNRDILLQTLAGYAEAERRARLRTMTDAEALAIFAALYETWKRTGKQAGGDWEAVACRNLESKLKLRQAFQQVARSKGLI